VEVFSSLAEHNPIRKTSLQMYIGSIYCNQKVTNKHQRGELFTHTGTWLKLWYMSLGSHSWNSKLKCMEQEEKKWTKVGDLKVMGECELSVSPKKFLESFHVVLIIAPFFYPLICTCICYAFQSTKGVYVGVSHDNVRVLICFLPSCGRKWLLLKNFHCSLVFVYGFKQPNFNWWSFAKI
jgi:hypothetical protein